MTKLAVHPVSLGPDHFGDPEIFSAFYPLGCLVAYAKVYQGGVLAEALEFGKITPLQTRQIPGALAELPPGGGVFLLSDYVWNHPTNMEFARRVKELWPGSLVVVGGPHVPRHPEGAAQFFHDYPAVDVTVRHEGEITLAEILDEVRRSGAAPDRLGEVDLSGVLGLTFRWKGDLLRTPDQPRNKDLSIYPSPYTTGEFDHWLVDRRYMPLETNRGCPYGCTFCDWGAATLSKIAQLSLDRVMGEIEYAAKRRVQTIGFCDANFGILPRDLDIVKFIIETTEKYGYPKDVGYTNAKSAKPRLTEIVKLLKDAGLTAAGQISMQTTDQTVLDNVERANIKTDDYRKMIAFFHQEGIPAVSDMMLGLPGQTFETCRKDLQFFFDHKVLAVIFATSVMPNAPMADPAYRKRFGIELDADGMVEATYSFDRDAYARMFELCLAYKFFVKLGVLKYLLYFAQLERGVPAVEFVVRWLARVAEAPALYPISARVKAELLGKDYRGGRKDWLVLVWQDEQGAFLFDDMETFQSEILRFFRDEHGVPLEGSDVDAVLTANREIMPRKDRTVPASIPLAHDVAGYFATLRKLPSVDVVPEGHVPLAQHGPGSVLLREQVATTTYRFADIGLTYGTLELASNLSI